jgi:hypothetical protein
MAAPGVLFNSGVVQSCAVSASAERGDYSTEGAVNSALASLIRMAQHRILERALAVAGFGVAREVRLNAVLQF